MFSQTQPIGKRNAFFCFASIKKESVFQLSFLCFLLSNVIILIETLLLQIALRYRYRLAVPVY
jgi:arginine exporter protein ArgO